MKTKDLYNFISNELQFIYPIHEADSMAFLLLEHLFGISQTDIIIDKMLEVDSHKNKIDAALKRLINNEPLQYITGKAHFYDREFKVDTNVLIPRNETEELVHLIINENTDIGLKILDIGTGSGCIPITLYHELNKPQIEALDVCNKAVAIAQHNANALNAEIIFHHQDVLNKQPLPNKYDIIVSNPPYVTQHEKKEMRKNVLDFEPHMALFVENNEPLLFYNSIIAKAQKSLNKGGRLYFEINEQFGKEVAQEMENSGFTEVMIVKDLNGKDRIVRGELLTNTLSSHLH